VAAETLEPIDLELPIRGMVTILADAARITECLTGRSYPLSRDGDFATLEAAYLASGVAEGSRLLASFDGRVRGGEGDADGEGRVEVKKFTGVWPDETCEPRQSDASLTNTWWKILRLGSAEIVPADGKVDPHLTLSESEMRFEASVGCNQMFGGFTVSGDRLTFSQAASTMMACPPPLDDWERQLSLVLTETAGWRVDGQALELTDSDGGTLALFQAVHLR
jgi:heat shock protein HslJ